MYRWLLVVLIACSTTVDAETYVGEIGGDRVQMDIELDGNAVRGSMRWTCALRRSCWARSASSRFI